MQFSVIIPTRNRPELLKVAIESVLAQMFDDFEIIVVNDGFDEKYDNDYRIIELMDKSKVRLLNLESSWHAHGCAYARNMGAKSAIGDYICFLDDDDYWIDANHLSLANNVIKNTNADVYFTNQQAYLNGRPTEQKLWLAPLQDFLLSNNQLTTDNFFQVDVGQLTKIDGFCHHNTIIIEKDLFKQINGEDENLRTQSDWDFYLRLIDNAEKMIFNPKETSRHNIPDSSKTNNISTSVSDIEKMLNRLSILDKAILFSKHTEIKRIARIHKIYTLKKICEILYKQKDYALALFYAKEAMLNRFNLKWLLFTLYIQIKAIFSK